MIWNPELKIAFFHVTKTAGWSIMTLLKDYYGFEKDMYRHGGPKMGIQAVNDLQSYTTFAVVRNPFERLLSWYYHMIFTIIDIINRGKKVRDDQQWLVNNCLTFKDFVYKAKGVYRDNNQVFMNFRQSQINFLQFPNGDLPTYILRFEDLYFEWRKLCNKLEWEYHPLPRLNASRVKIHDYRSYYTPDMIKIVSDRYKEDLDYFGYTFNGKEN
mgnify:CR=1 FL=1